MHRISSFLVILTSLLFVNPVVHAGNVTLGLSSGSAEVSDNTVFDDPDGSNFFVGYKSGYLFGFEFSIFGLRDENTPETETDDVVFSGKALSLTLEIPLGFITVFGKGGLADWAVYENDVKLYDGHSATYGGGVDFHFSENWAVRAEQQRYTKIGPTDTEIIHTRIGFVFIFD